MYTLGSDPEIFVLDTTGSHVVPAYFVMGGDIDWRLPYGKAYPDGAAIEFTVEPAKSPEIITERIWDNLRSIKSILPNDISLKSNADVGAYIPLLPENYGKRASLQILGCQKDIRVYDWLENPVRPDPKVYPYRTIGTHIHIELEEYAENWPLVQFITAYLDAIIGTAGVYVLEGDEAAKARNVLYGKSGTIRLKNKADDGYDGLEYRTLPSHAVLSSPAATFAFFDAAQRTTERVIQVFEAEGFPTLLKGLGGLENLKELTLCLDEHAMACFDQQQFIANNVGIDIYDLQNLSVSRDYILEV